MKFTKHNDECIFVYDEQEKLAGFITIADYSNGYFYDSFDFDYTSNHLKEIAKYLDKLNSKIK